MRRNGKRTANNDDKDLGQGNGGNLISSRSLIIIRPFPRCFCARSFPPFVVPGICRLRLAVRIIHGLLTAPVSSTALVLSRQPLAHFRFFVSSIRFVTDPGEDGGSSLVPGKHTSDFTPGFRAHSDLPLTIATCIRRRFMDDHSNCNLDDHRKPHDQENLQRR